MGWFGFGAAMSTVSTRRSLASSGAVEHIILALSLLLLIRHLLV